MIMNSLADLHPEQWAGRKAWQIDRELRLGAVPLDRRTHPSNWDEMAAGFPSGDDLLMLFWFARVPGSGAPEIPYVEMVQSMHNKGYEVGAAEQLLPGCLALAQAGRRDDLRAATAELLAVLHACPPDPASPYWSYHHPARWPEIVAAMAQPDPGPVAPPIPDLAERIYHGWLGQIAGGAFGTALEGYHSSRLLEVYGVVDDYLSEPETMNDDVVYELVLLDVFERLGRGLTARDIGLEWVRQIPFGWSAEWVALNNLAQGILPPESGAFRNPYSDWIGAQMRGMVCGFLAPGWPLEAARLAFLDGQVSHSGNGVYGEMYAAVLTALAFVRSEPHLLLGDALRYLPQESEYVAVARECLHVIGSTNDYAQAWQALDRRFEQYNWIHAYPNLAADLFALWYGAGDFTRSFSLLAHAGLDVDCNAGLVGSVLGVMNGVPARWALPLHDRLDTYLKTQPTLSLRELAQRTARLVDH
jgi:ADP-ribosylglycohydrolase